MLCSTCRHPRDECYCDDTLPSARFPVASEAVLPSQALVDAAAEVFDEDEAISELRIVRDGVNVVVRAVRIEKDEDVE